MRKKVSFLAALVGAIVILLVNPGCQELEDIVGGDRACARCNDGSDYTGDLCSVACSGNGGVSFYYERCSACE